MTDIYENEDVKMGLPIYAKLKVKSADTIFDQDTGEPCGWFVYCTSPMGVELVFPTEEFKPEIGTEFSIRFNWGDE